MMFSSQKIASRLALPTFLALLCICLAPTLHADQSVNLSEEALFYRCYGQIVRKRAPQNHPLLLKVKAKTLSAVDACMQLLAKGNLVKQSTSEAYKLADVNDSESKAILKTFHDFHRGWIEPAQTPDNIYADLTHQFDYEEAAAFFTNALFGPAVKYSSVVQENRALKVLRNKGNFMEYFPNPNEYNESYELQQGEITGVQFYPVGSVSWWSRSNVEQKTLTALYGGTKFSSKRSFGGGIMGLQTFIWGHIGYPFMDNTADGAIRMPRRWAKHLYSTLLCREIPLLRTTDVSELVAAYKAKYPDPSTHIPFRPNSNCMSCHAALDPFGSAIRNVSFVRTDVDPDSDRQAHIYKNGGLGTSADEALGFHLIAKDENFYRRPPNTMLFYRSYDGTLNQDAMAATSIEDALTKLGARIATKDDFYMCVASRYFQFFTGIKANLLDYQDARNGGTISESDAHYRAVVKSLADSLKQDPNQSVQNLIRKIISLPLYRTEGMRDIKP